MDLFRPGGSAPCRVFSSLVCCFLSALSPASLSSLCPSLSVSLSGLQTCWGRLAVPLGANRFCRLASQRPWHGAVRLPGLEGPGEGGWRSGWRAQSNKKRGGKVAAEVREGGMDGSQSSNLPSEVTPPPPTAPPTTTRDRPGGIPAFQRSSFSWQGNPRHAGGQNPISGFAFHHQWNGIWWSCYKGSGEVVFIRVGPAPTVNLQLPPLPESSASDRERSVSCSFGASRTLWSELETCERSMNVALLISTVRSSQIMKETMSGG